MSRRLFGLAALSALACGGAPPEPAKLPPPPPPATAPATASAAPAAPDRAKLPAPAPTPSWALPRPQISTLKNGMKVYFMQQGPTPLVSVLLVLPRGAATDPKGKAGLTALTVDMLDEGAGGQGALELSEALQRLGTDYSGNADVDYVMLAMNTIADSYDASVALLASIVQKPAFDAKEFARRKSQRIADALAAESEPSSARTIVLRKALFGDGYGSEIASGTRPTLGKLGLADVKAQYAALMVPEGAAFIVVGGVEQAQAVKALEASFGEWKGAAKAKSAPVSSATPDKAVFFVDYPGATQTALAIARRAPGEGTAEYFPAMVMSRVFGEAFTSRLNLNLREAKGYTYGAGSSFRRFKETGLFGLTASVKRETTRASIDESFKELRDLCASRPISAKERDEAVGGLLLGFPGRFERGGDVAGQLANIPLYSRPDDWLEKWSERVKSVSVEQANELAKGYCNPDDFVVVLAGDRKLVAPTLEGLDRKVLFFDAQGNKAKK
ncbi:MAG: insulinase family protein [Polyangiaceae bacterium]|nr:insulinase family protein [Polyangiaceae bacterium]